MGRGGNPRRTSSAGVGVVLKIYVTPKLSGYAPTCGTPFVSLDHGTILDSRSYDRSVGSWDLLCGD